MAELIKIASAATGYRDVLDLLLTKGKKQESRNGNTVEVEDLVIELAHPALGVLDGSRPGYNETIGMVEGLQLIAGVSDSSLTCEIQPNFRAFMDDGRFWGAYGLRTVDQLPIIVERLKADPDTRQAVVTLWDPKFDAHGGKKDHPCTTAFNFRIRDDKLNMTTFMRSNDAYWGWPYDVYQFTMLQRTIANVLDVREGTYTHHAASFHLYEPHWEIAQQIVDADPYPGTMKRTPFFSSWDGSWESARDSARDVWHVVRGVKNAKDLESASDRAIATALLRRKVKVSTSNLEKLENFEPDLPF